MGQGPANRQHVQNHPPTRACGRSRVSRLGGASLTLACAAAWALGVAGCSGGLPDEETPADTLILWALNEASRALPENPPASEREFYENLFDDRFRNKLNEGLTILTAEQTAQVVAALAPPVEPSRVGDLRSYAAKINAVGTFHQCMRTADTAAGRTTTTLDLDLRVSQINASGCLPQDKLITREELFAWGFFEVGVRNRVAELFP